MSRSEVFGVFVIAAFAVLDAWLIYAVAQYVIWKLT